MLMVNYRLISLALTSPGSEVIGNYFAIILGVN